MFASRVAPCFPADAGLLCSLGGVVFGFFLALGVFLIVSLSKSWVVVGRVFVFGASAPLRAGDKAALVMLRFGFGVFAFCLQ